MSKIISIVVVLAVIVLLFKFIGGDNSTKTVNTKDANVTNTTATTTESTKGAPLGFKLTDRPEYVQVHLGDGKYNISPSDITITWTGRKVILKNWVDKGNISLKEGSFIIKNGDITSNKFVFDMTSIKALSTGAGGGQDKLSKHLMSADFFDVAKFATSTFVVNEIIASTTENNYILKGDLTIKDSTNEISIPVTMDRSKKDMITAKGSVDIDRTLWNVKYGSNKFFDKLGDNVIDDKFNISFDIKINTSTFKVESI